MFLASDDYMCTHIRISFDANVNETKCKYNAMELDNGISRWLIVWEKWFNRNYGVSSFCISKKKGRLPLFTYPVLTHQTNLSQTHYPLLKQYLLLFLQFRQAPFINNKPTMYPFFRNQRPQSRCTSRGAPYKHSGSSIQEKALRDRLWRRISIVCTGDGLLQIS